SVALVASAVGTAAEDPGSAAATRHRVLSAAGTAAGGTGDRAAAASNAARVRPSGRRPTGVPLGDERTCLRLATADRRSFLSRPLRPAWPDAAAGGSDRCRPGPYAVAAKRRRLQPFAALKLCFHRDPLAGAPADKCRALARLFRQRQAKRSRVGTPRFAAGP